MFVLRRVLEPKVFLTTAYFFYIQVHVHEILSGASQCGVCLNSSSFILVFIFCCIRFIVYEILKRNQKSLFQFFFAFKFYHAKFF